MIFDRPASRPILTLAEARQALAADKLGTVYRRSKYVFVATAYGIGFFTAKEWDAFDGEAFSEHLRKVYPEG